MLSAPISSPMCSVFGRRRTMMSMTVPMTLGWLLITFATDATMILVGRALCSAVSAIAVPAAYTYVAEIASSRTRGFLGKYNENSIFLSKNGLKTVIDFFTREKSILLASNGLHFEA